MTRQQAEQPMTDGEISELAGKVVDWRKTLTPKERAFMDAVIQRAVSAGADVQGYGAGLAPGLVLQPPTGRHTGSADTNELTQVQLAFQKIQLTFSSGGAAMSDSWNAP